MTDRVTVFTPKQQRHGAAYGMPFGPNTTAPQEHWEAGADLFAEHSEAVQSAYAEMEADMLNKKAQEQHERVLLARGWRKVGPGFWRAPATARQHQLWAKYRLVLLGYALGLLSMLLIAWAAKL